MNNAGKEEREGGRALLLCSPPPTKQKIEWRRGWRTVGGLKETSMEVSEELRGRTKRALMEALMVAFPTYTPAQLEALVARYESGLYVERKGDAQR